MAIEQATLSPRAIQRPDGARRGEMTLIRPVTPADLPAISSWDEDPEIVALMGQKFIGTTVTDWYEAIQTARDCLALAIADLSGRLIGEVEFAQVNRRNGSAELRICIGEKAYWGQGYGTDSLQVALRYAFHERGFRSVYLRVYESNLRAVRLYLRLGFRKEAVMEPSLRRGDPSAVILMSLRRERWLRSRPELTS